MKLSYKQFGTGRAMIILHGLFGQSDNWLSIGRIFSLQHTVYLPDARNHGTSLHSDEFSIEAMCSDLLRFIEEHAIEKPIIIGHSMGGKVAMAFAASYPDKIEKLIVVDIAPKRYENHKESNQVLDIMQQLDLNQFKTRSQLEKYLEMSVSKKLLNLILKNSYYTQSGELAWKLHVAAIRKNMPSILEEPALGTTPQLPALFIRGSLSDYLLDEDLLCIQKTFPTAQLVTIAGASHWVHADKPDELVATIKKFL